MRVTLVVNLETRCI